MTDVASLELCKELYELSGWQDTDFNWAEQVSNTQVIYGPVNEESWDWAPAYDLGYLLRKLPVKIKMEHRIGKRWAVTLSRGEIQPDNSIKKLEIYADADTPEDAVCKLAIELIKQGVLKP